ncbi:uncharacterized protein BO66DRAFT_42748 [Aspergillus aculeatinus CBS 121060]|uniref:Uncharacterized protein n=1 Tax=Aspergillus aculeatinus CBS 121060 TaxID=1448322 RepID=A0ACD1HDS0_9EURO|nr:hypothetical protein BO66DRAFT_42748 [Aspergillus aculeatinus CBS 121060]RAH71931.1 hypothetical protein BO66DRAFT_42748 [Aspergillus aculeatinus CBS 121060]
MDVILALLAISYLLESQPTISCLLSMRLLNDYVPKSTHGKCGFTKADRNEASITWPSRTPSILIDISTRLCIVRMKGLNEAKLVGTRNPPP